MSNTSPPIAAADLAPARSGWRARYWRLLGDRSQDRAILRMLRTAGARPDWRILDVGCGFGRNLRLLRDAGLAPVGVEVNPATMQAVRRQGFACLMPDDPELDRASWDLVLMSHIIEHFDYRSLLEMMNGYLARLRPGGHLLIATPLPGPRFYDNFDHVKPYTPQAIEEVFGRRGMQVQFQSPFELELIDLWVRRRAHCLRLFPALLRRRMSAGKALLGGINLLLAVLHTASLGRIGTADGWAGLYRRVG